jgi:glutamine---fructose-6-phosphate transaminase (isomerizing)
MNVTEAEIASQPVLWERGIGLAAGVARALRAPGERMLAVGCGTSWFVAQCFAELRERAGFGETDHACASELPHRGTYDRIVAFTRSGTTTEVLDALRAAPRGTWRIAVTAAGGEPVDHLSDERILLDFANERSVVQTRFPTTVLAMVRAVLGDPVALDGRLSAAGVAALDAPLPADPARVDHTVFLGTGWTVGLAHEAALKVREAAQAWSESYPAMEFRHGPVAVAGPSSLVWAMGAMPDGLAGTAAAAGAAVHADSLDPLAQLVLAQRFAVAMAAHRGLDPDRPRLLTRSVVLADPAPTEVSR